MPDLITIIKETNLSVSIENKPNLTAVIESKPENALVFTVNTVKGGPVTGSGSTIQTKIYPISGFSATIQNTTHGFTDLLNYYVVNADLVPVEVVFLLNNNNIQVLSNVSLNNHLIIIKGYN